MKIRITKESLIKQLPDGEDLPDEIVLDGLEHEPPLDVDRARFPEVYKNLSKSDWGIFKLLIRENANKTTLMSFCNSKSHIWDSVIATRIYQLRKRLAPLGFGIETVLRGGKTVENYRLIYPDTK